MSVCPRTGVTSDLCTFTVVCWLLTSSSPKVLVQLLAWIILGAAGSGSYLPAALFPCICFPSAQPVLSAVTGIAWPVGITWHATQWGTLFFYPLQAGASGPLPSPMGNCSTSHYFFKYKKVGQRSPPLAEN